MGFDILDKKKRNTLLDCGEETGNKISIIIVFYLIYIY